MLADVYPASEVGSRCPVPTWVSASPRCQSLTAALNWPAELTASRGVACARLTMMGDQSSWQARVRSGIWRVRDSDWRQPSGHVRFAAPEHGVADACQLVG